MEELALQVSRLPSVEAVILGGSASTGMLDQCSDYYLYLYTREAIEPALREAILGPRAARLELQRDYWEWEDTWIEHDGTKFEIRCRGCGNTEQEVERRLSRYEASVGYTSCVLHTLAHGHILVDQRRRQIIWEITLPVTLRIIWHTILPAIWHTHSISPS